MSQWLEAITDVRRERAEKPAPGFKTIKQIAAELEFSPAHTAVIVGKLVAAKRAKRKDYVVATGRRVPHFRLKK